MTAIFKREFKSCFTGMIGWVIAAVSLFFLACTLQIEIFSMLRLISPRCSTP